MKKKPEECATCIYWMSGNRVEGVCRRYPPSALIMGWQRNAITMVPDQGVGQAIVNAAFAPMAARGWCGEYRRKK